MTEESDSLCPSCGAAMSIVAGTKGRMHRCPSCSPQDETPGPEFGFDETVVTFLEPPDDDAQPRTPQHAEETLAETPANVGRFLIVEILGSGGFGNVYRAHDPLLDREVALKVPRLANDDPLNYDRFLHEAKAAARLRHPNIVAVFECGVEANQPYIASEFVDGTPLSTYRKNTTLSVADVVEIVRQVAEAIDYAHSEGIVHRDLKPANIMMSKSGRPQVMDFGLARLTSDAELSVTSEGSIVGTPAYMAPEQARGDKQAVGPKSDQYSVGVLLYVLLCGKRPYLGDAWSVISRVADPVVVPQAPRTISKDVPRDLEACCLKAMEKEPDRRYLSLCEMADDLSHWLEGRPLLARPIGIRERWQRWCQRNRLIAGLLSVISGLILTALVVGYVLVFKFKNLATTAEEARIQTEQVLMDTFAETGLDAGREGRTQEAMLWFGNAAARADEHPHRERLNRTRFQAWLSKAAMPVRMFQGLGVYHESLSVHPSGDFVLSEQYVEEGQDCQIWNVSSGAEWPKPWQDQIHAATWSHDGDDLALASDTEVRVLRFPTGQEVQRWQHADTVHRLLFTPDGHRLAVGGETSTAVHEVGSESSSVAFLPSGASVTMTWSPSGNLLATLGSDRKVHVWNPAATVTSAEPVTPVWTCPITTETRTLQFLSEELLLVPAEEKEVSCWDVSSGQTIWTVPCDRGATLTASPDLSRVAIINRAILMQVEALTGEQIGEAIQHPNLIYSAVYDPAGQRLLTGCGDQFARVFSATTGELQSSMLHGDIVHHVAWFPSGAAFASVQWKADLVRVWRFGKLSEPGFTRALPAGVMHVKWNDDGSQFLASGVDMYRGAGACAVLKTADGSAVDVPIPISFPGRVSDGCFIPGKNQVVMAGSATADELSPEPDRFRNQDANQPGLIHGIDLDTGTQIFPPLTTGANVIAVEPDPDGRVLAALCHDGELLMVDAVDGTVLHRHQTFPGKDFFYGYVISRRLAFSPTGDRFAVWGSRSRTVEMRRTTDGVLLFSAAHTNPSNLNWIQNVAFSPNGKLMASCSADHTVQLWNTHTGAQQAPTLWHTGWVFSAEFSKDGRRLLTSCQDRQARLWDLDNTDRPLIVATPAQADEVYATCFLPGEESFLIGLRNGEVSAWDTKHGRMIAPATTEPHQDVTYGLSLSPDRSRVIIVSRDANVRGFPPARWQPVIDSRFSGTELRSLGEIMASRELHDGVLIGMTSKEILARWTDLFQAHSKHPIFHWPTQSDSVSR